MKRLIQSLLAGSVSMVAIVGVAHAQPAVPLNPSSPMMHHVHPLMVALPGVTLSADQKAKIHAILEANRPDPTQMNQQDNPRHQLMLLLQTPGDIKRNQLEKLEKRINKANAERLHKTISVALAIRGVLTPEQLQQGMDNRAKLQALHAQVESILHSGNGADTPPPPSAPLP